MSILKIIGEGLALTNKVIDQIDSPEKRVKARREFQDHLLALKEEILKETDAEKRSELIDMLITAIKSK